MIHRVTFHPFPGALMVLQSLPLTLLNLFVGGRTRFFCWASITAAAVAISPLVICSIRHPELRLFEQGELLGLCIVLMLGGTGVWMVFEARELLEIVRVSIDDATTGPARRRLASSRRPLILDPR